MNNTVQSIQTKCNSAVLWTGLELSGTLVVQFVLGLILARLLEPAEFGTLGMVAIFLELSLLFINAGMGHALIYRSDASEEDENTLFYFNLFMGLLMSSGLWAASGMIADFYNVPQLRSVCRVLALDPLFNALGFVQFTLLRKKLFFKPLFFITLISTTISGISGVLAAWHGWGIWALILQNVSNNFLRTLLLWIWGAWRPKLIFSWQRMKVLSSYGLKVLMVGISDVIFKNIYSIILGKLYSPALLGYYMKARNLEQLPGRFLQNIISRVSFSAFSALNSDRMQLKEFYRKSERDFLVITLPVMVTMGITAEPLIRFLLTDKWLPAVPILQVFCLYAPIYLQELLENNLVKSMGFPGLILFFDTVRKLLFIGLIFLNYKHGVIVLILLDIATIAAKFLLIRLFVAIKLKYRLREQLSDLSHGLLLAVIVAGGGVLMLKISGNSSAFLRLLLAGSVAAGLFLAGGLLIREPLLVKGLNIARRKVLRRK